METFHMLHLAASWPTDAHPTQTIAPPISDRPSTPAVVEAQLSSPQHPPANVSVAAKDGKRLAPGPRIRAASAQIIFAARNSRDFITPEQVNEIEAWTGLAVLEALRTFEINPEVRVSKARYSNRDTILIHHARPFSVSIRTKGVCGSEAGGWHARNSHVT